MSKQHYALPVVDLNLVMPPEKQSASPATHTKPVPFNPITNQSKVNTLSGGFRIPQAVMDEKRSMFTPQKAVLQPPPQKDTDSLSQNEIFAAMGLKPLQMKDAILDKQNHILYNQPLAQSKFLESHMRIIEDERNQIRTHIQAQMRATSPSQPQPSEEPFENKLEDIQKQIGKHYERLQRLEKEVEPDEQEGSVWEKIRQLKEHRKQLKEEQKRDKEQYDQRRKSAQRVTVQVVRAVDPKVQAMIDEHKHNLAHQKKIVASSAVLERVAAKSPERQIYEHQFEEFEYEKKAREVLQRKIEESEPKFDKYRKPKSYEHYVKLHPAQDPATLGQRAVVVVDSVKALHKLQIASMSDAQLMKLDPQTKKALFKTAVEEGLAKKHHESSENEEFVLKFTFQSIDKDMVGVISKEEALKYIQQSRDLQIIFDLRLPSVEQAIADLKTNRQGMLNYQEYCALVRQLRDAHLKEIKAAKNNVALEEENHEYLLVNKYMTALRKTFDEMDLKKEGVVSRVDLIKLIRSEHPKLLHLPVSTSSGAATVNQVLEKVLSDYRKCDISQKASMMVISLPQLESYFKAAIPPSELQLLQARIILAHFGPGSLASEGFYQKVKGRCQLTHEQIKLLMECFMAVDMRCDLIVEKARLISKIKDRMADCLNATAILITELQRRYSLREVLASLEDTIVNTEEPNDSMFISLQMFTDLLTKFTPAPRKADDVVYTEETAEPQPGKIHLYVNKNFLQVIQDVFNMVPRVYAHFVLKEELVALLRQDPQTKSLMNQLARIEQGKKVTIGEVVAELQQLAVDYLQWNDVVHLFNSKDRQMIDTLNRLIAPQTIIKGHDTFTMQPKKQPQFLQMKEQRREAKQLGMFTSQVNLHSDDEEYKQQQGPSGVPDMENMSFDEGDLRAMKVDYDAYARRIIKLKAAKREITVPQAPHLDRRSVKQSIRQRKVQQMIDEIQQKEEFELHNKFRAHPLPNNIHMPLYSMLQEHDEQRRMQIKSQAVMRTKAIEQPFSFYQKDVQKMFEKKAKIADREGAKLIKPAFKAKEVPVDTAIDKLKQKEIEDKRRREELKAKGNEMLAQTAMPKRLQEAEAKRKEKMEKMKNMKPSEIDPECQFNPKIKKVVPKAGEQQKKFEEKLATKKEDNKKAATQPKPFNIKGVKGSLKESEVPNYLDEDNQRQKVPQGTKPKPKPVQQPTEEEPVDEVQPGDVQQEEAQPDEQFEEAPVEEQQEEAQPEEQQDEEPQPQDDKQEEQPDVQPQEQEEEPPEEQQAEQVPDEEQPEQNAEEDQPEKIADEEPEQQEPQAPEEPSQKSQKPSRQPTQRSQPKSGAADEPQKPEPLKPQPPKPAQAPAPKPAPVAQKPVPQPPQNAQPKADPPAPPSVKAVPPGTNNPPKEKPKVLSSADREQQMLAEERERKKQERLKAQAKLDPNYNQKMQELNEKLGKRELQVDRKQHGSSTLEKYRRMAKEQAGKGEEPNTENKDEFEQ